MRKILALLSLTLVMTFAISAQTEKAKVLALSKQVITTIKNKDMNKLATFVHPAKGIRFSPYSYVETETDLVFKANVLRSLMGSRKIYLWGTMDESGIKIKKTFRQYYDDFVYDFDFARAYKINYNLKENNGIMITNVGEVYPKGIEVEYWAKERRTQRQGGLRLIYEKSGAKYYLVGIVSNTPGI